MLVGCLGLFWFGIPAVLVASELIASRATGVPIPPDRVGVLKDYLFKVSGSIVFAAAGVTLHYLSI